MKKISLIFFMIIIIYTAIGCKSNNIINNEHTQDNIEQNNNENPNLSEKNDSNSDMDKDIKESDLEDDNGSDPIESFKNLLTNTRYNLSYSGTTEVKNPSSVYVLINKRNSLPSDYTPNDLTIPNVSFSFSEQSEKRYLRQVVSKALENLFDEASENSISLVAVSGYRSYNRQKSIFNYNANKVGEEEANKVSAKPGQSEHQTGLAMDVSCSTINYALVEELGNLPEGIWLKNNAHKHGFIIRYPKEKISITEYNYEPWHIRYVGPKLATFLFENDLTLEEFYKKLNTI